MKERIEIDIEYISSQRFLDKTNIIGINRITVVCLNNNVPNKFLLGTISQELEIILHVWLDTFVLSIESRVRLFSLDKA